MDLLEPDNAGLLKAAEALRKGEVVAYPTETVYGLAVDPSAPDAIAHLFTVKGRQSSQAVLLIGDSLDDFKPFVSEVSVLARNFMREFWPGPLSLLLPAVDSIHSAFVGPSGKVCVRVPDSECSRALCRTFGGAITSTSANRSGEPAARSVQELPETGIAIALEGGILDANMYSTVYDPDDHVVVRSGAISTEQLQAAREIMDA